MCMNSLSCKMRTENQVRNTPPITLPKTLFPLLFTDMTHIFTRTLLHKFGHILEFSPISKGTCITSDSDAFLN